MKPTILIVDPIDENAVRKLSEDFKVSYKIRPTQQKLKGLIRDKEIIILRSGVKLDKSILDSAKSLKLIARAGNGLDNIDIAYAEKIGIKWFNVPAATSSDVAEFTVGLMISISRRIVEADKYLRRNDWRKDKLRGNSLRGKTLGIIGFGKIGKEVANIAEALGMKVIIHTEGHHETHFRLVELGELLENSDFVSLHVPLTEKTKNLIQVKELEMMKKTAFLINTSRGGIINEKDLYYTLKNKIIAGAAIDVFENEREYTKLFELDNIVVTPHIGAMSIESQKNIGLQVVNKIKEYIESNITSEKEHIK